MHIEEITEITVMNTTEIAKSIRGFSNGKAYSSDIAGGKKNAFYSEMTYDEFTAYLKENSSSINEFNAESASEKTSVKRSDGGWSLVFEKFSDSAKADLSKDFKSILGDTEISDVRISIVLDRDLYYKSFIMDLFFPDDSVFDEFSVRMDFSAVNTGTTEIDEIDFNNYTKVADIRVLDKLDAALNYVPEEGEKQSVTVTISEHSVNNGNISRYKETDKIVYETVGGKLKYEITADVSSNTKSKYIITYEDGTQNIERYSESGRLEDTTSNESSDDKETAYILGILNSVKYSSAVLKTMKVSEDTPNTYILTCDVPEEFADTSSYKSATLTVIVTLDAEGEISKIDSEVYIKFSNLNTNTYTLTVVCDFGEKAE